MQDQIANNPGSSMLREVAQAKAEAQSAVKGHSKQNETEELPEGTSPIEARSASSEGEETPPEETSTEAQGDATPEEDEGPIRIGDQTFKTNQEAIRYAEQLEREKLLSEAHAAGVREALEATRIQSPAAEEPEDDFDARFYANPKGTFQEVEDRATQKALAIMQAEKRKEDLWDKFLTDFPDVRRKDAERILRENADTIGKITDTEKGMKALAQLVRSEYQEIVNLTKPRTELPNKGTRGLSPSGGTPQRVTQPKKDDAPLDFISQMKKLRG